MLRLCLRTKRMHFESFLLVMFKAVTIFSKDCLTASQCSCQYDDGSGTIDLTSLGNTDNTPRFRDLFYSPDNNYYSYNPCGGFNEGSGCSNAAVCQISSDKQQQIQIGDATAENTAFKFDETAGSAKVSYLSGSGVLHLTEVALVCDPNACDPVFTPLGQPATFQYLLQMTTICACPGRCTSSGASECSGGLGAGSILLIVFFSLVFIYVIGGTLFKKFVTKAEGKDIIPNSSFWLELPSNIKGGILYTVNKMTCRQTVSYDNA